jgi:hypothetical protein
MSLISEALYIREQSEQFLVDSCIIKVWGGFTTVDGEYAESFTDSAPTPCRVINKSGKTGISANAKDNIQLLTSLSSYRLQLPYTTTITTKDKILYNSILHDVVHVPLKHSLMGAFVIYMEKQQ